MDSDLDLDAILSMGWVCCRNDKLVPEFLKALHTFLEVQISTYSSNKNEFSSLISYFYYRAIRFYMAHGIHRA